jgi:hypothetical protein
LAGVRGAGHLGHSKSVYTGHRHRGIFHLSAHAIDAAFVGPPRVPEQGESVHWLGMQVALVLPFSMLLLVPLGLYNLNWFFPALLVLLGAHYLPFATLYGMRMFLFLAGILMAAGVVIAQYFSGTFSPGAWTGGLALFVFAWIGPSIATGEASAASTH